MKLILPSEFALELKPKLSADLYPDIQVAWVDTNGKFEGDPSDAEVYLKPDILEQVLAAAPALRWQQTPTFHAEPLPGDSPFWSLPNVFVTPHCSGFSPRIVERTITLFLDNLIRYRAGKPLRNVVDKTVGY